MTRRKPLSPRPSLPPSARDEGNKEKAGKSKHSSRYLQPVLKTFGNRRDELQPPAAKQEISRSKHPSLSLLEHHTEPRTRNHEGGWLNPIPFARCKTKPNLQGDFTKTSKIFLYSHHICSVPRPPSIHAAIHDHNVSARSRFFFFAHYFCRFSVQYFTLALPLLAGSMTTTLTRPRYRYVFPRLMKSKPAMHKKRLLRPASFYPFCLSPFPAFPRSAI